MTRWRKAIAAAVLATGAVSSLAHGQERENSGSQGPKLRVRAACDLPGEGGAYFDIRWSDGDALVLQPRSGVRRVSISKKCEIGETVLPGSRELKEPGRNWTALTSSGDLVAASSSSALIWADGAPSPGKPFSLESLRGGIGDVDLRGTRLVVLGMPSETLYREEANWSTTIWAADFRDGRLGPFEPVWKEREAEKRAGGLVSLFRHNNNGAGALRQSSDGDILVSFAYRSEIARLSPSGEVKARWALAELTGVSDEDPATYARLIGDRVSATDYDRWVGKAAVLVDDVLFLGRTPAAIVRLVGKETGQSAEWVLVLLDTEPPTKLRIPSAGVDPHARLRADVTSRGEIVILATQRIAHVGDQDGISARLLVLELNN